MQVEVFAIADAATDSQGKLNILGAFDTIWAQMVPVVHPACTVAIRLRFVPAEGGHHNLQLRVVDELNVDVMPPMQAELNMGFPQGLQSAATNIVINIQGLRLLRFGQHEVRLHADGAQIMAIPLLLNIAATNPQVVR